MDEPHPTHSEPRRLLFGDAEPRLTGATSKISADQALIIREKALEILRRELPAEDVAQASPPAGAGGVPPASPKSRNEVLPARMLNEFVYCPRLFYYEFVEGVFVESADTLRGAAIHARVDSGSGEMPVGEKSKVQSPKSKVGKKKEAELKPAAPGSAEAPVAKASEPIGANEAETIHSRSVQMGSERLGVVAKMDLVEVRPLEESKVQSPKSQAGGEDGQNAQVDFTEQLFRPWEVCPVDYKAGAPREGQEANELWDTDKMQLGVQALILRENGYTCNEGIIYYRATKQRVRLAITAELEAWILQNIARARRAITEPIPPPLVNSPKCVRCSLAPVCLPDETIMLGRQAAERENVSREDGAGSAPAETPTAPPLDPPTRRLMAARDDTRALYLNTPGLRIGCSDEVLQVKEKDKLIDEIRLRDLSNVALFGNIQISTQAVQSLCELELPLSYFSMGGWFYGLTRGHGLKNVFLRIEQFRLARDEKFCLAMAKQLVHGKIRNHRTLLMRNHVEAPEPALLKLKRGSEDALAAHSLEELLGIEGAAASQYFQHFNGMIKIADDLPAATSPLPSNESSGRGEGIPSLPHPTGEGRGEGAPSLSHPMGEGRGEGKGRLFNFNFMQRNRRPPTDPINAMLSLAYSMLSKDCTLAALAVGFDPYIGFFHQPRFGRPALGLDLMEEFRPLIAESTVLTCINNHVITESDFVRAGQAVNLTTPARKRFFQTYEQRMSSLITHPLFDYKVSYRRALELQARLLAKAIGGEIPEYIPLMTR